MIRDRLRARGLVAAIGILTVVGMLSASVVVAQAMAAQEQEAQKEHKAVKEAQRMEAAARRLHEHMRRVEEETSRGRQRRAHMQMPVFSRLGLHRSGMPIEGILARAEDLGLSDEQVDRIRSASRAHRRAGIERKADIEIAELDLREMFVDQDTADLNAVEAKMQEVASLKVEDRMAGLRLRQQVRGVLSPEQQEQLEDESGHNIFMLRRGGEMLHRGGDGPRVWRFRDGDGEFDFDLDFDFEGLESLDWVEEFGNLPFGVFEFKSEQEGSEGGDDEGEENEGVSLKKSKSSVGVVTL